MRNVDERLRELFEAKAADVPPQGTVPPSLRSRARRRIALNAIVAVMVIAALGGGAVGALRSIERADRVTPGGKSNGTTGSTTLGACAAGQLRADASLGGAMGSREGAILVENVSSTRCALQGYPRFRLLDASGRGATAAYEQRRTEPQWKADRASAPRGWPVVTLRPGARASVRLRWSNWCGTGSEAAPVWTLRVPGSGRIDVMAMDATSPPPCNGPGLPSTISVGPFEPAR
jgi:hypothetical protein